MNRNMVTLGILAVVVLLLFAVSYYYASQTQDNIGEAQEDTTEETAEMGVDVITVKHDFVDGTHIIAGSVDLPTPCHLLETNTRIMESFPEQVVIDFITTLEEGTICAQVVTPRRFKISFDASERAVISATINAESVRLNLVDVPEGESLENFEVEVKG